MNDNSSTGIAAKGSRNN